MTERQADILTVLLTVLIVVASLSLALLWDGPDLNFSWMETKEGR